MNKYIYYIEFYGKKLKIIINTTSIIEGKKIIKEKIIFHKIKKIDDIKSNVDINMDAFNKLFGDVFK